MKNDRAKEEVASILGCLHIYFSEDTKKNDYFQYVQLQKNYRYQSHWMDLDELENDIKNIVPENVLICLKKQLYDWLWYYAEMQTAKEFWQKKMVDVMEKLKEKS